MAKLQFEFESGKLADLSDQQKERLKGLAEELDRRKELKQANEDAAKLNAFTSTAAIPIVGPFAAPAAAASALGAAGSFMGMIGSVAGMAHDGIDSVPQDGTWLLQKGERVTTAETSAKLDRTLEQVSRGGGGGGNVQIHNYSNSQVSAKRDENGQLQVIIKAVEEHLVSGMLSGAGDLCSTTQSAFNLKNGVS